MDWSLEPPEVIPLALMIFVYVAGTLNIWVRAGVGHGITMKHLIGFIGSVLALIVALLSPLDALSDVLFSAHMTQHLLLILVAAPLLVMSNFPQASLWALPGSWAHKLAQRLNRAQHLSRVGRLLSNPLSAWFLFTITFWIWHASALFEAALRDENIHTWEHFGFLVTAMLFWWVLIKPTTQKHLRYGLAIPYLFMTILQSEILGALITFASHPWYSFYMSTLLPWNITPLQDQQLAGLIMWLPAGAVFTLLAIGYFVAWLDALEQRHKRLQRVR